MKLYRKLFYIIKIIKNLRRNKFDTLKNNEYLPDRHYCFLSIA